MTQHYTEAFISDIIRMAWADDISFDNIKKECGLNEAEVIKIMRSNLKASSFRLWRKRVSGRSTKHEARSILVQHEAE
ncbi:MAG: TIGR03643 family protein [Alphaproteobacteria bacterium]|nr:MAG: TIGR03643 family protein [Alphaproteobacteria bacterium]